MFFEQKGSSIILRVRLTPNSSSCIVKGIFTAVTGENFLKLNVVAVPEKGKANQELINFLAKKLRIAKSDIKIISGETDRYKKLEISNLSAIEKLSALVNDMGED